MAGDTGVALTEFRAFLSCAMFKINLPPMPDNIYAVKPVQTQSERSYVSMRPAMKHAIKKD